MEFSDSVSSVLARKGCNSLSVPPGASVYDALNLMADHDIGAVMVMEADAPVGIFSERDYARKLILLGRTSMHTPVSDVMSAPVFVGLQERIDMCLRVMTGRRLRHLVILDGNRMAGIVSIGDLVNWMISAQAETIEHLSHYVTGAYPC